MSFYRRLPAILLVSLPVLVLAETASAVSVTSSLTVTNNTDSDQFYSSQVAVFSSEAFGAPSFLSGSIDITLTDNDGDGATLQAAALDSVFVGKIQGADVATMLDDPYSLTAGADASAMDSDAFDSVAFPIATQVGDLVSLRLAFVLSAGDTASISAAFSTEAGESIPEPSAALLFGIGALAVGTASRRRA